MIRIRTKGSMWVLDDGAGRYCRFPLDEGGRERPEWGDERAGVLRDAVWHPMLSWRLADARMVDLAALHGGPPDLVMLRPPGLVIETPEGGPIWAPWPVRL